MTNPAPRPASPGKNVIRHLGLLVVIIGALILAGCGSTATHATRIANSDFEATGWPFRWVAKNAGGGGSIVSLTLIDLPSGPTKADAVLKQDTLTLIAKSEAAAGRPAPQIEDIKLLTDGREVWVLNSRVGDGLAYVVAFTPSPQGGVDISLRGPQRYSRPETDRRSAN